jgi:hypothetical protein
VTAAGAEPTVVDLEQAIEEDIAAAIRLPSQQRSTNAQPS